jgi:hypothetical protein
MKDKKDMPKFEIHFHDKVGAQIAYVEHFHAQFDKDMNMQVMDVNGEINKALKELDTDDNEKNKCEPSIGSANDYKVMLSTPRQSILDQLLNLADKGDWVNGITSEDVKAMLKIVLGQGETPLSVKETEHSEILWRLLESGRGDRVKIVWQNIVGYLDDKKLFRQKGSPALNKDFFGDDKGYTNIDKGRPNKGLMTPDFESIIPLLDAYVPKLDKKA